MATAVGIRRNCSSSRTTGSSVGPFVPSRRLEPSLGIGEASVHVTEVAVGHERPDVPHGKYRTPSIQLVRECPEPESKGGILPSLPHVGNRQLDQVGGPLVIVSGEGMADGLPAVPLSLEPAARAAMELGDVLGMLAPQVAREDFCEEVVVAVPLPVGRPAATRNRFARSSASSMRLPPLPLGDRVAQRSGQPVQDRGLEQEPRTSSGWRCSTSSTR